MSVSALFNFLPGHVTQTTSNDCQYVCQICFEEIESYNQLRLSCNHQFCKTCFDEYVKDAIQSNKVLKIGCPYANCQLQLSISFI